MRPLHQGLVQNWTWRHLTIGGLSLSLLISASAGFAQESKLLESIKRNPAEAQALCDSFKAMNSNGQSAYSSESINQLARKRNLSAKKAEILASYVVFMHCSDVR